MTPTPDETAGELLPCLKERNWAGREQTVCRVLWPREASEYMPWLAIGYDHPHTFEFISSERLAAMNATAEALERDALANLRKRQASWQSMDVDVPDGKRLRMLVCADDFFAAERIADPDFMRQAQQMLRARGVLVGIPRRGMLLATNGEQSQEMVTAFGAAVAGQFSRAESAPISPMLFAVKDGAIVGIITAVAAALASNAAAAPDEEDGEDDPNAPYVSAIVARNDQGTEDVHLLAGGHDGVALAKAIESGFMALLHEHLPREQFSGHIQIVVLGMTPVSERKHVPAVLEHLRGICSEISKGDKKCRVSLTYQREDAFAAASPRQESTRDASRAPAGAVPAGRFALWKRLPSWLRIVIGLIAGLLILNRFLVDWLFPK